MSLPPLYLDVADIGPAPPKARDYFFQMFGRRYSAQLTTSPDLLIYSHSGDAHKLFTCRKFFHTSESTAPDWSACDYAATCRHLDDPRHLRVPYYMFETPPGELVKSPGEETAWVTRKTKFCAFATTYRNAKTRLRWDFFKKLSRYKRVDSIGREGNNIGQLIPFNAAKFVEFIAPYKFYLAFENESVPGYITEKLTRAMRARCIPIYYGCPRVAEDFNPRSFLNYHDFPSEEALIERIIQIDRDDALHAQYLREPFFHDNRPNLYFDETRILDFLDRVVRDPAPPRAHRHWLTGRWKIVKRHRPPPPGPARA